MNIWSITLRLTYRVLFSSSGFLEDVDLKNPPMTATETEVTKSDYNWVFLPIIYRVKLSSLLWWCLLDMLFFLFFWFFFGSCRDAGNLMDHVLSWVSEDWSDGTNFLTELHCIVIGLEVNFSPNLMAIQGLTNSGGRAWMGLNRSWLVWHRFKRVNMSQNCVLISEMDIDFAFGVVKNSLVILFTLWHTILMMWVWRIWYRIY